MTTKRNNLGFTMIIAIIAIALVGSAVFVLSQMSRDLLFDVKQARQQAIQGES